MKIIDVDKNLTEYCAKWCCALLFVPITCFWALFFFNIPVDSTHDSILEIIHVYVLLCMCFVISQTVRSRLIVSAMILAVINSVYDAVTEVLHIHEIMVTDFPVVDAFLDEGISVSAYLMITIGVYKLFKDVKHRAMLDDLTGVYSRRAIEMIPDGCYEIFYLDLDNFKQINDTNGHDHGDMVLIRFSKNLLGACEDNGYILRIGGDEFVGVISLEHKDKFIDKVHALCDLHKVKFSYGNATFDRDIGFQKSLKKADEKLYEMKELRNAT